MKSIVIYYSRTGENYWNGSIKNLSKGNTEIIAEMIADITGSDLFRIDTVKSYAKNYYECIDEAKTELQQNARPELQSYPENLDDYDTIFLGYPNWWGTMPMAMFTLLDHCDMSNKTIIPFCTNEGSGMGESERDLKKACPHARIEKGLSIHGAEAANSRNKVETWIRKLNR